MGTDHIQVGMGWDVTHLTILCYIYIVRVELYAYFHCTMISLAGKKADLGFDLR